MKVSQVLDKKGREVVTARPQASVQVAARLFARHNIGAVLLSRDGRHIDGIFTERDLARGVARQGELFLQRKLHDVTIHKVYTCAPEDDIHRVVLNMRRYRIRHMPVAVGGMLAGMITVVDILREFLAKEGIT